MEVGDYFIQIPSSWEDKHPYYYPSDGEGIVLLFVNYDTENDGCVTVRDRDTMESVRMPIGEVKAYIESKIEF